MVAIITRKLQDKIIIDLGNGKKIVVQYVLKRGNAIRLLVDFPEELEVYRGETREARRA